MPIPQFGALSGVRVIDFTQMLAGPFCTQLLADQGADVVKVEPPGGEETRRAGGFRPEDTLRAFGGYFASVNRNKRSISLNLKEEAGRDLALKLIDEADVVVENYRAGVMDRLGLGYEKLRDRNPRIVYAAIRGFGDPRTGKSPSGDWPAYDVVAQAMGGIMQINGADPAVPTKVGPGVGDIYPATLCAFGIAAALIDAKRTGEGQFIDVSMVDAVLALCERTIHQHSYLDIVPQPEGNRHPMLSPFGVLPAKDGFVTVAAHFDPAWTRLCRCIGREELIRDPRTATYDARALNRDFVYEQLEAFTRLRSKQELAELFGGVVPFGPVLNVAEIVSHPHFAARDMVVNVEHPGLQHPTRIAGIPIKMTRTPGAVRTRAPLCGEHTDELLREAGLSETEIAALRHTQTIA